MDNQHLNDLTNTRSNTGQVLLPPKIPNASASPPSQCISNQSDKQVQNLQSSSARILTEEPPPWLEELLNEPETPVTRGHRRSASDPFTYLEANSRMNADLWLMNTVEGPSWDFQKSGYFKDMVQASSSEKQQTSNVEQENAHWKSQSDCTSCFSDTASQADDTTGGGPMLVSSSPNDQRAVPLAAEAVRSQGQSFSHDAESSSRGSEASQTEDAAPASASKPESKQLKQHNGRRSRVRKLQYIVELERNVQVLQVEGSAVCAELQFLDQRNLILVMENRALKQRLQSLSQVQIIKSMEQEILKRELARLQYVYHQQNLHLHLRHQQHPPPVQRRYPMHHRGRSCDLDSQFARFSLNPG